VSESIDTLKSEKVGAVQFISETRDELKKVSFPSSDDVRSTTLIVILNVIFFAIFLFLVDQGWNYILQGLEWLVNKTVGL
jgi:preprotein translocase SecE subunit